MLTGFPTDDAQGRKEGTTPLVMNATGAWQRPVNCILSKTDARTQESIAKRGK